MQSRDSTPTNMLVLPVGAQEGNKLSVRLLTYLVGLDGHICAYLDLLDSL
jgi:hypothetical protein